MSYLRIIALSAIGLSCGLEYEYGWLIPGPDSDDTLEIPGGRLEFLAFEGEIHGISHAAAQSPSAPDGLQSTLNGPWYVDVMAQTSDPTLPTWDLAAGDWVELELSAVLSSDTTPLFIEARHVLDDGGELPVRIEFAEEIELTMAREGLTRLDDPLSFTLVERLTPHRWFPTVNLTNLDLESDGSLLITPSINPGVYAQIATALDHSARDWLDP